MFCFFSYWERGNLKASESAVHFKFNLKTLFRFAVNELWENECGSTEFSYTDEMFSLFLGLLIVCSRVRNYYCFISFEGISLCTRFYLSGFDLLSFVVICMSLGAYAQGLCMRMSF